MGQIIYRENIILRGSNISCSLATCVKHQVGQQTRNVRWGNGHETYGGTTCVRRLSGQTHNERPAVSPDRDTSINHHARQPNWPHALPAFCATPEPLALWSHAKRFGVRSSSLIAAISAGSCHTASGHHLPVFGNHASRRTDISTGARNRHRVSRVASTRRLE